MERRRYLALLATALAGCGQPSDSETATSSPTDTTAPATTQTSTTTPTETDAPTRTETPTETETESPTPDPRDERLDEAASLLAEAVDAYVDSRDSADGVTGVTADVSVSKRDVRSPLFDVRDALSALEEMDLTDEQNQRRRQLRGVHWFLWWLGSTHDDVRKTYETVSSAWNRTQDRDWFAAGNRIDDVPERASDAGDGLGDIKSDSDADDVDGFDRLTPEDYDAKIDQFEDELDDAVALADVLHELVDGFESYEDGGPDDYFDARRSFENVSEELDGADWADPYADLVDEATCVADAMAAGCEYLDRAARAEEDGDEERAEVYRTDAQEEFEACDLLRDEFDIGG